jgi:hypothetical protein
MTILSQEFDALTGLKTTMGVEDGKFKVRYEQDVSPALDYTEKLRNADDYAKQGIKQNFQHIGHIPPSVCLKMRTEDGFDAWNASAPEIFAFLRKHRDKYGKLLTIRGLF